MRDPSYNLHCRSFLGVTLKGSVVYSGLNQKRHYKWRLWLEYSRMSESGNSVENPHIVGALIIRIVFFFFLGGGVVSIT